MFHKSYAYLCWEKIVRAHSKNGPPDYILFSFAGTLPPWIVQQYSVSGWKLDWMQFGILAALLPFGPKEQIKHDH